jgi:hypothetical protein
MPGIGIDELYSSLLDQIAELQKANDYLKRENYVPRPLVLEHLPDYELAKKKKDAVELLKSIEAEEIRRELRTCTICFDDKFIKLARYRDYWTAEECQCNARICDSCVTRICTNKNGFTGCPSCRKC